MISHSVMMGKAYDPIILQLNILAILFLMNRSGPARKKLLLMEQFISILLIFRLQLSDLSPYIYYSVLLLFLIGKHFKEGNTAGSPLQYISALIIGLGDACGSERVQQAGIIVAVLNFIFVSPVVFTLPEFKTKVGLRDNYSNRGNKVLYYAEWYPVKESEANELYQIPWNHTVELERTADHMGIHNKFGLSLFNFLTSSNQRYKLTFSKGEPAPYRGVILFSHGRSGTPFVYSSILQGLARQWKILSPQHWELARTPYKNVEEIKRFRELEVKQRAEEIVFMASKVGENEEIVLMGHSYGGGTVIEAYHSLHLSIRKRVSHIILLDPWLFPLPQETFDDQIVCPVLMMSNQYFLYNKDVHDRNRKFVKRHGSKVIYFCWQGADHLHQTDLPFILGNSLRQIRNAKDCIKQHEINTQAIDMFLEFEKVGVEEIEQIRAKFGEYDLGSDYTPAKFTNELGL